MDVKIHPVHFKPDQKLTDLVRERSAKLTQTFDRLSSVDVYLKLENNHQKVKEKVVEIKMSVPGQKLFVMNKSLTFEDALHQAIDSAVEMLRRKKEEMTQHH